MGHVPEGGQRYPSPAKAEALDKWEYGTINTAKQLKGFLGLVGWYLMYIKGLAHHAAPLMDALKGKYQYEAPDLNSTKNSLNMPVKRKRVKLTPKQAEIVWPEAMIRSFK